MTQAHPSACVTHGVDVWDSGGGRRAAGRLLARGSERCNSLGNGGGRHQSVVYRATHEHRQSGQRGGSCALRVRTCGVAVDAFVMCRVVVTGMMVVLVFARRHLCIAYGECEASVDLCQHEARRNECPQEQPAEDEQCPPPWVPKVPHPCHGWRIELLNRSDAASYRKSDRSRIRRNGRLRVVRSHMLQKGNGSGREHEPIGTDEHAGGSVVSLAHTVVFSRLSSH